jgi:subtilisin family serine protease
MSIAATPAFSRALRRALLAGICAGAVPSAALAEGLVAEPVAGEAFATEAIATGSYAGGAPGLQALNAANPNFTEWSLIRLTATDVASAGAGAGVKVAVLDGRTDCRDTDLTGRCTITTISGGTYRTYSNHGTHTAGIVAGAQYGVATGATVLNYAVFDDTGWVATGTKLAAAWKAAYGAGARIASMSFGCARMALCFSAAEVSAIATSSQPMLYVKAAGNDGVALGNESIAVSQATATAALNRLLLVGSVNQFGAISSFSNRPGEGCLVATGMTACTAATQWKWHFLVAPGEAIVSNLPNNAYGSMSGTSMATPVVAGVAALLQKRWPALKTAPETLARILLTTATDLGAPGVDAVYGYGLLDATRAFKANGTVTLATTAGTTVALTGSTTTTGSATLARIATALGGVTVFDQFGRDYSLAETGALTVAPDARAMRQLLGRRLLGAGLEAWSAAFFADRPQPRGFAFAGSPADPASAALGLDRSMRMGLDVPIMGGPLQGSLAQLRLTGAGDPRLDLARDDTMRPLAQFASTGLLRGAMIGSLTAALPGRTRIMAYGIGASGALDPRMGMDPLELRLGATGYLPVAAGRGLALASNGSVPARSGFGLGLWKQAGARTVVGFNASSVRERDGYYTLASDLPFLRQSSRTWNAGVAAFRQAGRWEINASAEVTRLVAGGGAGVFAFSPATLVSGELGLRRNGLAVSPLGGWQDSLALSLALPPRAVSGRLSVDYLATTADGLDLAPASMVVPLAALGQDPVKIEAAYRLGRVASWSLDLTGGINLASAEGLAPVEGMVALRVPF